MPRIDKITELQRKGIYYSDFTNSFSLNPITQKLDLIKNADSVRNSLINLILTKNGERFYDSTIGSKINSLLFDLMDESTAVAIEQSIRTAIENHEPRVEIDDLNVIPDYDNNRYVINLNFFIINIPEIQSIEFVLERVR